MIETKRIPQTERSERIGHVRNSFTSHSKKRSNTEEEFLKKIIRDDELIKKITICKEFYDIVGLL